MDAARRTAAEAVGERGFLAGPAGIRVLVEENHDLPIVRLTVTLLIGGAEDAPGREGLSYFATELACRGAGGRTREEIDEAFERLGADLAVSADADAVTWDVEVLSDHLEPAFSLLCDVLLRPDLPEVEAEKLRREMHAALDELRDEDGAVARRFYARHLYGDHPYGKPLGGTRASIDRLDVPGARRWLERAVCGRNLIVAAAGDVERSRFLALVGRRLGVLRSDAPSRLALPQVASPDGLRLLVVDKPERTQSQLLLGQPVVRRAHPDFLPLAIGVSAFGGTFTARLMREVRVKRGLSYGASARLSQGRGARALSMSMAPSLSQTVETLALVLDLWREFVEGGLSDDEVVFSKDHMASAFAFQIATPEDRIDLRLGVEICELPADFQERFVPEIRAVTKDDVHGAMRRVLRPRDLAITVVSTASELLPALRRAKLVSADRVQVVPFDSY